MELEFSLLWELGGPALAVYQRVFGRTDPFHFWPTAGLACLECVFRACHKTENPVHRKRIADLDHTDLNTVEINLLAPFPVLSQS